MSVTARSASGRSEEWFARLATGEPARRIRRQLGRWYPEVDDEQIAEVIEDSCLLAHTRCDGASRTEVMAWVHTVARRRVRELAAQVPDDTPTDPAILDELHFAAEDTWPEAALLERERQAEFDDLTHAVLDRLTELQLQVIALHSRGLRRPQIAARLSISDRAVKKALERVMLKGRAEVIRLAGGGCRAGREGVSRYAFGFATARQAGEAQLHLATCASCQEMFEQLESWRGRVAALTPAPVAAGDTDVVTTPVQVASHGLGRVRDHLDHAVGQLKSHVASSAPRAMDPTPFAGARPGAAAAAIASCLAVGAGATYCVENTASPVSAISSLVRSDSKDPPESPKRVQRKRPVKRAAAPAPAVPTATQPTVTPTQPDPAPQPAKQEPAPLAPAPEDQFEPTNPNGSASTSGQTSSQPQQTRQPAAVPDNSPPEFGGP